MIITCNCGEKKFTLPDNSIPSSGRLVQCGYCGLKWKQFPVDEITKTPSISRPRKVISKPQPVQPIIQKPKKTRKNIVKKPREISLYSPEYLAKKHRIKKDHTRPVNTTNKIEKEKISFGFYNSLIVFIFLVIAFSRILYFSQNFIISYLPASEYYLNYFFESIRIIFEIWKSLVTNY